MNGKQIESKPESRASLFRDLRDLLNRHSVEGESNTPDFILADYMLGCLQIYENTLRRRTAWCPLEDTETPPRQLRS